MLQGVRPAVFSYAMYEMNTSWYAGQPVMLLARRDDRPYTGSNVHNMQLLVPDVVTANDLQWLRQGAFHVQR